MSEMEKITGNSPEAKSLDITNQNIEQLKQLFPDVFSEGKIDFEALKAVLGAEIDDSEERYNFTWNGKIKARQIAQTPSTGTLRPCKEESVNWETTENLFIEGDNLEVLKLLQKSYHKKVKMIYIDPPYNTGKDFVYKDNFHNNIKNYLEISGQADSAGNKISTNAETSGRYHSDWLNMMYPRLKLARNLLKDDGIVFISIDEHEVTNLSKICDEIFGEDNNICQLVWKKKYTGGKHSKGYADFHEYILVYVKDASSLTNIEILRPDEEKGKFVDSDEFVKQRGKYYVRPLKSNLELRPTLIYPIEFPDGSVTETQWLVAKDTFEKLLSEKRVEFRKKRDGTFQIYKKYYETDGGGSVKPPSLIEKFPNTEAKAELKFLFDIKEGRDNVFYTAKPTNLLKYLFEPYDSGEDIILDLFAGSGSTADAVMRMNDADNGNRKFILIQIPEEIDGHSSFSTISDITKARLVKVKDKIIKSKDIDTGFKVLKLDSSNILPWDADFDNLEQVLQQSTKSIKDNRSSEDVLYEIFLKYGYELTTPLKTETVNEKKIFVVGAGALIVCLDDEITTETVEGIAKLKAELDPEITQVVFKDEGFADDRVKTNAIQILKQAGIEDVKSI